MPVGQKILSFSSITLHALFPAQRVYSGSAGTLPGSKITAPGNNTPVKKAVIGYRGSSYGGTEPVVRETVPQLPYTPLHLKAKHGQIRCAPTSRTPGEHDSLVSR